MARVTRLLLAFGLVTAPCHAAPTAGTPCAPGSSGALTELACKLGRALSASAPNAVVVGVAAPPSSATPFKPAIAVTLAVKVALALGNGAVAWPLTADRARLSRLLSPRPLVVVEARVNGDGVEARAGVFGPRLTSDPNATAPLGDPVRQLTERHSFDAEARRYLPPVPIIAREFVRLGASDSDVVALACGDLYGTGIPVVASIGRTWISFGTLVGGKYTPSSRLEQRALAPVAAVPLREPIGSAWITPERTLDFGLSDRAHASRAASGGSTTALAARLPWPGGGCATLDALFVSPRPLPCAKDEPVRAEPGFREPFDAVAGALIVAADGSVRLVRAGRQASDGAVLVSDGTHGVKLEHAGAQLALGDLDGDGAPELVTSLDTLDPRADAVVVHSWLGSVLRERLRLSVPTGVRALAVCPESADRMGAIVLATSAGLWTIR